MNDSNGQTNGALLRYPSPPLTRGDLALRPLRADDAEDLARGAADPDVLKLAYSDRIALSRPEVARGFIAEQLPAMLAAGSAMMLGIFPAGAGPLLGAISLSNLDLEEGCGELGCWVVREARGQGVAADASALLCAWAFEELGLHRIQAVVDPANAAAEHVLRGLGFTVEGILRGAGRRSDGFHDCRMWSLLATDAPARALVAAR